MQLGEGEAFPVLAPWASFLRVWHLLLSVALGIWVYRCGMTSGWKTPSSGRLMAVGGITQCHCP